MPEPKTSPTALSAFVLLLLSLAMLVVGSFLVSMFVITGAIVIGLAATTSAVLSLRED